MSKDKSNIIHWPSRLSLASSPTPFHSLNRISKQFDGPTIWVKRDDLSGSLLSGNKVRKLEFTVAYALAKGHDSLITCGGLQSNHCRATAFVGAQLGIPVHLVLRGDSPEELDGNLLLDHLAGATVHYISPRDYQKNLDDILETLAEKCRQQGANPYIIPTGASNGVGVWGYLAACKELQADFKREQLKPDLIVTASGSGGTQAGLSLGAKLFDLECGVLGMAVCDSSAYFQNKVREDINAFLNEFGESINPGIKLDDVLIQTNDSYIGDGYAMASDDILDTIITLSQTEGILLDPVYTAKAFYGLLSEIKSGRWAKMKNIVFLHTGGHFGLYPYKDRLSQRLEIIK